MGINGTGAFRGAAGFAAALLGAAFAWWSAPFILLLGCYLIGASALASLAIGIAGSILAYLVRRMPGLNPALNNRHEQRYPDGG